MNQSVDVEPHIQNPRHEETPSRGPLSRLSQAASTAVDAAAASIALKRHSSVNDTLPQALSDEEEDESSSYSSSSSRSRSPKSSSLSSRRASQKQQLKKKKKKKTVNGSLEINVDILQAQDLMACNKNFLGQKTVSDPYVIVSLLMAADDNSNEEEEQDESQPQELVIGKTKPVNRTLHPTWDTTLSKIVPAPKGRRFDSYTLQFKVMDYELVGEHNCLGIVRIPLSSCIRDASNKAKWYKVMPEVEDEEGPEGEDGGRIEVAIQTKMQYSIDNFLPKDPQKRHSAVVKTDESLEEEDEDADNHDGGARRTGSRASKVFDNFLEAGRARREHIKAHAQWAIQDAKQAMLHKRNKKDPSAAGTTTEDDDGGDDDDDEYENIYEDQQALCLNLILHQADGLVAKDRKHHIIGKKTSSDPYVVVEVWPKGIPPEDYDDNHDHEDAHNGINDTNKAHRYPMIPLGKSPTIRKNLSPVWDYSFEPFQIPMKDLDMEEAQVRLRILDDDFGMTEDDPMGSFVIYLQPRRTKQLTIEEKWYAVSAMSTEKATGRVQVSLSTLQCTQKIVVGQQTKKKISPQQADDDKKKGMVDISSTTNEDHSSSWQDSASTIGVVEEEKKEEDMDDRMMSASMPTHATSMINNEAARIVAASSVDRQRRRDPHHHRHKDGERTRRRRHRDGTTKERRSRRHKDDGTPVRRRHRPKSTTTTEEHKKERRSRSSDQNINRSGTTSTQHRSRTPSSPGSDHRHNRSRSSDPSSLSRRRGDETARRRRETTERRHKERSPRRDGDHKEEGRKGRERHGERKHASKSERTHPSRTGMDRPSESQERHSKGMSKSERRKGTTTTSRRSREEEKTRHGKRSSREDHTMGGSSAGSTPTRRREGGGADQSKRRERTRSRHQDNEDAEKMPDLEVMD